MILNKFSLRQWTQRELLQEWRKCVAVCVRMGIDHRGQCGGSIPPTYNRFGKSKVLIGNRPNGFKRFEIGVRHGSVRSNHKRSSPICRGRLVKTRHVTLDTKFVWGSIKMLAPRQFAVTV